jgi:small subunit ribosomal protein S2
LLEAGVHFGHQKRRWNPKMKKYVYTVRNQIYIIDLKKTLRLMREAYTFVRDTSATGGKGIFVGTKKQASEAIEKWAHFCGMHYVNHRWLGGTLTNFKTIRKSIDRMIQMQGMIADGSIERYSKKEQSRILRAKEGLERNLQGIRDMQGLPAFIFVIDPSKELIAVAEANKVGVPVVGVVDTNCDPDPIDYVIPGNDDAIRSINLSCEKMAEACIEGLISRVEAGLDTADSLPEAAKQLLAQSMERQMGGGEDEGSAGAGARDERPRPVQPAQAGLGGLTVPLMSSAQARPSAPPAEPATPPKPEPAPAAPPEPESPPETPSSSASLSGLSLSSLSRGED